jgi:hypothetical protein
MPPSMVLLRPSPSSLTAHARVGERVCGVAYLVFPVYASGEGLGLLLWGVV